VGGPVNDSFSYTVADVCDAHVVTLHGELDLGTATGLADMLVAVSGPVVVVDLSELTFMDSSGIAAMVQARNQLGDNFVLTRPQPIVRRVFEITGLGDWFTEWEPSWSAH